jgi:hypothetical protein
MQTKATPTEVTNTTSIFPPKYSFIDKEGQLCELSATIPEVKINQPIIVREGITHHNCKVISFSNKTNLIEIKINKKPAMCFRSWKDGLFFLVKKVPTK